MMACHSAKSQTSQSLTLEETALSLTVDTQGGKWIKSFTYVVKKKSTAHNNKLISTNTFEPFVLNLKIKYQQLVIDYLSHCSITCGMKPHMIEEYFH